MTPIRYTGQEGFTIPEPPTTKRQKQNARTFLVHHDVGSEMRRHFSNKDELEYMNKYNGADNVLRIEFKNHSIEPLVFVPGEVVEVQDDDIAEVFLDCRFWLAVKKTNKKAQ